MDEARRLGLGVDVASEHELQQTLDRGVPADDIVLTAAVKPRSLLELAVSSGVTVVLDNEDELRLLEAVADRRVRVAFRIAPLLADRTPSRFGLPVGAILELVDRDWPATLSIEGVHFHLDGYAASDRVAALRESLELIDALRTRGHRPAFIDMGGGIPMSYLDDAAEWERFWREHRAALLARVPR